MASSEEQISTAENEESSGELFADLPTKSKRGGGGIAPPVSAPRSQVKAAAGLVGGAAAAPRSVMPSSSGVHSTSQVPPAPPTSQVPAPPSGRVSAPPPPSQLAPSVAYAPPPPSMRPSANPQVPEGSAEYAEDNGDDATPVRASVDGTPTVKLPDVAMVRAMTAATSGPASRSPAVPPPPVSAPPPTSAAAAALAAGSGDPSSIVPPPPSVQQAAAIPPVSGVPRDTMHTVQPTSLSQPPAYVAPPKSGGANKLLVAAAAALVLVVGGLAARQAGVAGFGAPKTGALLASVAGPGGASVDKFELFVDGSRRCEASPCKVDGLTAGEHFLKVVAPGYETSAAISLVIEGGATKDHRMELVASKDAKADDQPAKKADETLSLEDLGGKSKPAAEDDKDQDDGKSDKGAASASKTQAAGKAADKSADKPATKTAAKDDQAEAVSDKGTINISSTPPVNVVVDGKPVGMTPKTVRVPAGSHTIVFIGPAGRQVRTVHVKGGGSASASASF